MDHSQCGYLQHQRLAMAPDGKLVRMEVGEIWPDGFTEPPGVRAQYYDENDHLKMTYWAIRRSTDIVGLRSVYFYDGVPGVAPKLRYESDPKMKFQFDKKEARLVPGGPWMPEDIADMLAKRKPYDKNPYHPNYNPKLFGRWKRVWNWIKRKKVGL